MKILKLIKQKLIHALGGVSKIEADSWYSADWNVGRFSAICQVKDMADLLYGLNADEWSKQMYDYIDKLYKEWKPLSVTKEP